jgi:hypothetical protein
MDRIKHRDCLFGDLFGEHSDDALGFRVRTSPWTVVSATGQSDSERRFLGMAGLHQFVGFCRKDLKIISGEMTGCVIKQDCPFRDRKGSNPR